jgi:RHS repeat-associated protein
MAVIGCSLNFYDGNAFEGLPYGQIGDFGVPVRSETLVITDAIITDAYGANTPECFKATPDWSSANGYPTAFEGLLQNGNERLGYKDRRTGYPNHIPGWYAEGGRMQYDFQQFDPLTDPPPVGLVLESKDVFDNRSTIEYDNYQLLPVNTKQYLNASDFLETTAEYDYRTFQANKVTDPNDNISVFDFSPLGLLKATAVIGKGTQGDYKSSTGNFYDRYAPSVLMEYDFFAFKNEANPIWVKTIQREQHYQDQENSPTILKVEYSDGFGRLLQTRAQAEDVIFGNQTFGTSGLSADQNAPNSSATGIERDENDPLNVVVSGWKIYNNKGQVVEQYEPFFDKGFDYVLPQLSTTGGTIAPQLGVKIKMYYDPLQRVVKTVNPDNSEQRVIFGVPNALNTPNSFTPTPWEQYTYDANDLAPLTNPNSNVPQSHWFTPKSSLVDALGRTIQTTEYKAHYNADTEEYENVVMRYMYDIRGNLLEVRDPYNRKVFENKYDLRPPQKDDNGEQQPLPPLWTKHIDSGESTVVFDVMGKVVEREDAKNARFLTAYDTLSRATHIWSLNNGSDTLRLITLVIYGESAISPKINNINGQLWKQYDESGKIETPEYDFKGNLLSKKQQVISSTVLKTALDNYETYLVDWTGLPNILETQVFETSSEFDALNRVTKITLPENVNNDRKEITPTYNRAGALEKVSYDNTEYVENIAYNAKGQRLLIAFGNDIMTRYAYDNRTFRLLRQRSEKYAKTQAGNTITYTPQSGTNKQDDKYIYDLIGNIFGINIRTTSCGVGGTDSLDKVFDYDPLYRVINGTGRENVQGGNYPFPGWDDMVRSSDPNTTQAYTRKYAYDKVGNVQQIKQLGTSGFTRDFNYISNQNKLEEIEIGLNSYNFTYDACGNQLTENTTRKFEWDAANRLILFNNQVGSSEPSVIAQYLYDSAGNRVKKIVRKQGGDYEIRTYIDGIFEHYTDETDEQNTVHIMDASAGSAQASRVATIRIGDAIGDTTPAIKYNLENNIYSSAVTLDDNGTVVNTQEYYPFGETSFGSYEKKRYQYVGKERDEESGLYYYGARYYTPWIARFISCDPLSAKYAQLSPYNYSDNNPINDYDIDGMQNNNSEESERSQPIIINANGTRDEKISEILNNLPKNSSAGKKINVEYQGTQDHDIINQTFEYNEKDGVWNLMKGVFKSGLEVDYNISIESTRLQESTKDNPMEKVLGVVDKVLSNKTVEEVSSGGGLASSMIETAASETKKEIISDTKRVNKVIVRNKMNVKLSGAWKKSAKSFSKIANVAKWVGRAFGGVDTFVNIVNAIKVGRDKNASTWKKIGAGLNAVASFASLFIKATPLGFALSLGITVFTSWWNK